MTYPDIFLRTSHLLVRSILLVTVLYKCTLYSTSQIFMKHVADLKYVINLDIPSRLQKKWQDDTGCTKLS